MTKTRKFGGHVSTSGGIVNAVKNTLAIGGNCMQIFAGSPRTWNRSLYDADTITAFRAVVEEHQLDPVFIHALYLTNLASDKSDLRAKSRAALITDLTNAAAIKSAGVILHIGSHQGRGFDADKDLVVQEIQTVLGQTPDNAILILENSAGQKGKIGSLEELAYLIKQLDSPRVGICLDTAHALAAGHEIRTVDGLKSFVKQLDDSNLLNKLSLLHINDSKADLGAGRDLHENLGQGRIGLDAVGRIANHPALAHLPLILEVPGFDGNGPDQQNIDLLKSIL